MGDLVLAAERLDEIEARTAELEHPEITASELIVLVDEVRRLRKLVGDVVQAEAERDYFKLRLGEETVRTVDAERRGAVEVERIRTLWRKARDEPRLRVVAAAVCIDGLVFSVAAPKRHHDILHALAARAIRSRIDEQGFLLSDGRFAMRKAAQHVALTSGQVAEIKGSVLTSEDLW